MYDPLSTAGKVISRGSQGSTSEASKGDNFSPALSYMWWPGLDKELQECARGLAFMSGIQEHSSSNTTASLVVAKPWAFVREKVNSLPPWTHTQKWTEVMKMTSTDAPKTISELRKIFAANGLPKLLVTDNGLNLCQKSLRCLQNEWHLMCTPPLLLK